MTEQAANLDRVSAKIGPVVRAFCRWRWRVGRVDFHMAELTAFVRDRSAIAPDSPGRILRMLRRAKQIDYVVVSRRDSLYRLVAVDGVTERPSAEPDDDRDRGDAWAGGFAENH